MRKRTLRLAAACVLAAAAAAPAQTPPPAPKVNAPAPRAARRPPLEAIPGAIFERELKDLDGQSLFLSNFRGQVLVINIWATWCGPCRYEMPEINKLHAEFAPRGVGVVGLNVEDPEHDAERVVDFVTKFGMEFPVAWADRDTAETLLQGRPNIPQTIVVAPGGRIVKHFVGFNPRTSPAAVREAVRRALGDVE